MHPPAARTGNFARVTSRVAGAAFALSLVAAAPATDLSLSSICGDCKVERYSSCGKFLEGPSFDPQGNLWMVSLFKGDVIKVTPDGQCSTVANTGGAPNGAHFLTSGKLLITDRDRNLLTYDPTTNAFEVVASKYGRETMRGLNDMVFDKSGGLYFTEPYGSNAVRPNGRVFYLAPGLKGEARLIGDNFAFPNGIALSPDEKRLYVADYATARIIALPIGEPGQVTNLATAFVFAYLSGGVGPDGLAVDANGNVYAAHNGVGEVAVLAPNGRLFGEIRLPPEAGAQTTNLAFHDGYLYITEGEKGDVWRVKVKIPPKAAVQ